MVSSAWATSLSKSARSIDGHPRISQAIEPVQRRHLVRLGEGRIVEDRVHEVVDRPTEGEHRLPDVYQLGRLLADDVHAAQPARLALEQELQHAGAVADDLAARDLAEERLSDLVGDA